MARVKGNKTRGAESDQDEEDLGAGPDDGKVRTGPESSKSLKYSQEVTSTEDEPEREGRGLSTTHHEVIRHQEQRSDGQQSNFFRLENPGREDA